MRRRPRTGRLVRPVRQSTHLLRHRFPVWPSAARLPLRRGGSGRWALWPARCCSGCQWILGRASLARDDRRGGGGGLASSRQERQAPWLAGSGSRLRLARNDERRGRAGGPQRGEEGPHHSLWWGRDAGAAGEPGRPASRGRSCCGCGARECAPASPDRPGGREPQPQSKTTPQGRGPAKPWDERSAMYPGRGRRTGRTPGDQPKATLMIS